MSDNFPQLRRLAAFTDRPEGGNPAGVWIGPELPSAAEMQRIATEVGYSETAFLAPTTGPERIIRYYSPKAEVSFCGHATIASGVALGETDGEGTYQLATSVGLVPVTVVRRGLEIEASLTSVEPMSKTADPAVVDAVLSALGWERADLDPAIAPAAAYAGAWHLVLALRSLETLAALSYDFERLLNIMTDQGLTTIQLIWRESAEVFHARNPFPVGGVVEDPATGAAAAALGGYLRAAGLVTTPTTLLIRQGEVMGRPSRLSVSIPESGGITVSGTAVALD